MNKVVDKDRGWAEMLRRAEAIRGRSYVRVGVLSDSKKGGLHVPGAKLTVAEIAAVHEFGTTDGKIPARSFIRSTFDEQRPALQALAAQLVTKLLFDPAMTAERALGLLGLALASKIRAKIVDGAGVPPPNAPRTALAKARKGKTGRFFKRDPKDLGGALAQAGALAAVRPLVDTGRLANSISWSVVQFGKPGTPTDLSGGGKK